MNQKKHYIVIYQNSVCLQKTKEMFATPAEIYEKIEVELQGEVLQITQKFKTIKQERSSLTC